MEMASLVSPMNQTRDTALVKGSKLATAER